MAENAKDEYVVTKEQAINTARKAVDAPDSGVTVPVTSATEVTASNGKYTITFVEPPPPRPIPRAGYYAIVIVDGKTGATEILGPP